MAFRPFNLTNCTTIDPMDSTTVEMYIVSPGCTDAKASNLTNTVRLDVPRMLMKEGQEWNCLKSECIHVKHPRG
jgi:hypothetical protein